MGQRAHWDVNVARAAGRRRTAAGVTTALLAASLVAGTASAAGTSAVGSGALALPSPPGAPLTTAQPLGPQPQVPARPCVFQPLGAQEMRYVFSHRLRQDLRDMPIDTVDPFDPCHSFGAAAHRATRSDGGTAPVAVVEADAPVATPAVPYVQSVPVTDTQLSPVITPAPQREYLFDQGSGYGVIESSDQGWHWEQRNTGLPVVNGLVTVQALAFAPSDPQVGYAAVQTPNPASSLATLLFASDDGGQSWRPVPSVAVQITAVAIDPGNDRHLLLMDAGSPHADVPPHVWESADGGQSWSALPLPQGAGNPAWLLVTHAAGSSGSGVRLYLDMAVPGTTESTHVLWQSRDDGATWLMLPLPAALLPTGDLPALAADPENPDAVVYAAPDTAESADAGAGPVGADSAVTLVSSLDGFASLHAQTAFQPPDAWRGVNRDGVVHLRLMADHGHDLFLQLVAGSRSHGYLDKLFAFRLAATDRRFPLLPTPPVRPTPASGYHGPAVPELRDCPLQVPLLYSQLNSVDTLSGTSSREAGSITFDGEYLDYTYDDTTPNLVYRTDPLTCQPAPALAVTVPPDWEGNPQPLKHLTYDARYVFTSGDRGAILAAAGLAQATRQPSPTGLTPVYAIDPLSGYTELALYLPPEMLPSSCCGTGGWDQAFTYDVFSDTLWVSAENEIDRLTVPPAREAVATYIPSCMSDHYTFGGVPDIATTLVGADGILYAQMEDDTTVLRADDRNCTLLDGFQHAKFSEPGGEDEQMACDPITFGDGSGATAAAHHGTSVIWIRDAVSQDARAYAVSNGYCPFPTRLSLPPLPASPVGAAVPLCSVLRRSSVQQPPIAGAAVTFSVDGRPAGSAQTDAAGRACVTATAPAPPGVHTVVAAFAGTPVFLPSQAQGPLPTYTLGGLPRPWRVGPLLPSLTVTSSEPAPEPQPGAQPAVQMEGQIQAQAQVQAQSQAQAQSQLQPGIMPQKRPQTQTAAQLAGRRQAAAGHNAMAVRRARPAPLPPALAGALLLAIAALTRRPAIALARRRRR